MGRTVRKKKQDAGRSVGQITLLCSTVSTKEKEG
jgi:hypothetical protein